MAASTSAATSGLCFPTLPPWPPTLEVRAAYLEWWLIFFLGIVGVMKACGYLAHDLSRTAGLIEGVGAAIFLPRWAPILKLFSGKTAKLRCSEVGCWLMLAGLGVIVSTPKRKSPVCWTQVLFVFELLRCTQGAAALPKAVLAVGAGLFLGILMQQLDVHGKSA
mmetsp:Transcript_32924/g.70636  ORF Transcript_32924/g.70636 Transcript_32924/m.70636 type:complete len:164 (-) Transcript_32924:341-832(-)